jgi:hypothetical protein
MRIRLKAGKAAYNESEASHALGVSIAQFRSLLLRHLLSHQAFGLLQLTRFCPSDLLLLGLLLPSNGGFQADRVA